MLRRPSGVLSLMGRLSGVLLVAPPLPEIRRPSGAHGNPTRVQTPNRKESQMPRRGKHQNKHLCYFGIRILGAFGQDALS